jgi:hypothetical protein
MTELLILHEHQHIFLGKFSLKCDLDLITVGMTKEQTVEMRPHCVSFYVCGEGSLYRISSCTEISNLMICYLMLWFGYISY